MPMPSARAVACAFAPELDEPAATDRPSPEPGPEQDEAGRPRRSGFVVSAGTLDREHESSEPGTSKFHASDCANEAADVVEQTGHRVFLLENAGFRPCYFVQDGWPDFESGIRQ